MKPFDPTKPYCRRDGKPARVLYTLNMGDYPVIVLSQYDDGQEWIYQVMLTGCVVVSPGNYDLVNIPEKIEGWINIYKYKCHVPIEYTSGDIYTTREAADLGASFDRIACIKVSFTEGEGLSDE